MSLEKTCEFEKIVKDIVNHEEFIALKHELHHGISRFEHSMRVAKMTYQITKKAHLDYERATRAALLHDFYTDKDTEKYNAKDTFKVHPKIALLNAQKYFDLDKKQANMIEAHMFPVCSVMPKYKESWIVTLADKLVASHEMYRYKAQMVIGIWLIFLCNVIAMQK